MKTLDAVIAESPVFAGLTQEQLEFIVGCGRCITWCPVGIDIREEVAAIRATQEAKS